MKTLTENQRDSNSAPRLGPMAPRHGTEILYRRETQCI